MSAAPGRSQASSHRSPEGEGTLTSAKRVMVYVQHLLGSGHLRRAALLGNAMTRAGMQVTLVSGGMPVPGLTMNVARFVQLPPVAAADLGFKSLVDAQGRMVGDTQKQVRRDQLLALLRETRPHAVVVELFPFGRRQMRFELLPLLDAAQAARPAPVIVSSVRDVLGGAHDPERQRRMLAYFDQYFDHLLVHGDPALLAFDQTFAHVSALGQRLHYTGYVVDPSVAADADRGGERHGHDEVVVSAGGGAVGRSLLEVAIHARALSVFAGTRWRILVGAAMGPQACADLKVLARSYDVAGGAIIVEPNRPDFSTLLRRCRLSISQAGYNTVIETLQAGARSVMVPFAGGSETEQALRARVLARHGWIDIVEEADLTAQTLAQAIERASRRAALRPDVVALDGADASARLIAGWIGSNTS